jgi:hypothetical protein
VNVGALRDRLRALMSRLKGAVVQDCPPELYACEVCGKLECDYAEWANCEKRIAAAEFVRSGNQQAVTRLKQIHEAHTPASQSSAPESSHSGS